MTTTKKDESLGKMAIILGAALLALAVIAGAFGAHGLEDQLSKQAIETYNTGVTYHFYHAFGLILVGVIEKSFHQNLRFTKVFFLLGLLLFSSNCYFYALSGVRTFALIVPFGGVAYILGWLSLSWALYRRS